MNLKSCDICGRVPKDFKRLHTADGRVMWQCPHCKHRQQPTYGTTATLTDATTAKKKPA